MAKPRVIISTDIGGADPDDMQSMAHALLAADQWQIEALISTPTGRGGRTSDIHKALDAYARDYSNLKTWSSDYPDPEHLESIVYQGDVSVAPSAGYSNSTSASRAIVKAAHEAKAAGEPLWVMAWGALTDVAQALHDDPSIASNVRVLASNGWNGDQDPNAYDYVVNTHAKNGLWMIDSKSTHRGIFIDSNGRKGNSFDLDKVKGDGALGNYFDDAVGWGVKMGDSWSIAYLTDRANNNNPQADSWGGEFVKTGRGPNYWTDDPSSAYKLAWYNGAKHVREHQTDIYRDMYKLFDRADRPNPDGTPKEEASDRPEPPADKPEPPVDRPETADPTPPSSDDSGGRVEAADNEYALDSGDTLWFNARYLTWNDRNGDGDRGANNGLEVVNIADATAAGVKVDMADDGTIVYRAKSGWEGTDSLSYTVRGEDGSTDTAKVFLKVGDGKDPLPSPSGDTVGGGDSTPPSSRGSGDPVIARDDVRRTGEDDTLWFNTRHLKTNDDNGDGGLRVTSLDKVSKAGVEVSWGPEGSKVDGTAVYEPLPGWEGVDSLNYTVTDRDGSTDTGTVHIQVGSGELLFV